MSGWEKSCKGGGRKEGRNDDDERGGRTDSKALSTGLRNMDGISDSMGMSLSKFLEIVKDRETWHAAVHGFLKSLATT